MRVFIIRHFPSHKKIYWKIVASFQTSKRTATSIYTLFPQLRQCHIHFFLSASLVTIHAYQTMSITSADMRKSIYISTLLTKLIGTTQKSQGIPLLYVMIFVHDEFSISWKTFQYLKILVFGVNEKWVQIPTLLLTSCMIWAIHFFSMSLNFLIYNWT